MATIKEIKGRITSTKSSEKITGAMKMISTAKLRKAEGALNDMRPYRKQLQATITHLLGDEEGFPTPLTQKRTVSTVSFVVIGSEEGLCGAFNLYIFKKLLERLDFVKREYGDSTPITLYPVGKKMTEMLSKMKEYNVVKSTYLNAKSDAATINTLTDTIVSQFITKGTDMVEVIYPYYKSMASQPVLSKMLLPVDEDELLKQEDKGEIRNENPYIYEPAKDEIFKTLIPMFVHLDMQECIFNTRTAEQAARVMAMQAASDNAKKLLDELQLTYNNLRQQGITNELLDIIGGSMQ